MTTISYPRINPPPCVNEIDHMPVKSEWALAHYRPPIPGTTVSESNQDLKLSGNTVGSYGKDQ